MPYHLFTMQHSVHHHSSQEEVDRNDQPLTAAKALQWQAPWLASYAQPMGLALQKALGQGLGIAEALTRVSSRYGAQPSDSGRDPVNTSIRSPFPAFVPQAHLPKGQSYEGYIRQQWAVPTREHLHDFFNGLIWLHWPKAKKQLNALQSAEIERRGVQGPRGQLRDACTLFDENGALLLAPAALHEALMARDWLRLFRTERALWQDAKLLVFGHALLEQLCQPRKNICAHVLTLSLPIAFEAAQASPNIEQLDSSLAQLLSAENMYSKPLTPLPVFGIPGWTPANEQSIFYEDVSVFRPPRSSHLPLK